MTHHYHCLLCFVVRLCVCCSMWHLSGQLARTDFFNTRMARRAKKFPFSPGANRLSIIVLYAARTGSETAMYTAHKRHALPWLGGLLDALQCPPGPQPVLPVAAAACPLRPPPLVPLPPVPPGAVGVRPPRWLL